ncbi:hypothetical protein KM043_000609 [Ampulex compressa]|nr:hypothetical protein KM043_000609 [Ampulex compressa]
MESGRQEVDSAESKNGGKAQAAVVDAYKAPVDESAIMGKQNGESELEDGAQERMLKTESKISPTKDATEVKFISENGDAKIDIETVKQALSGMDKEELMKFANDPFWVRLRWLLFVGFWLIWLLMLGGAVAIVVMAPKCSAPEPKQWWEESPIVRLDASDSQSDDLKGLESLLEDLKKQNIKAISLKSIVKKSPTGDAVDFKDVAPELGSVSDLESFVAAAQKKEQRVVLELDPNHSSTEHPWFKSSVLKEEPYASYYVWANGTTTHDGRRTPPNNWLSVYGGSAWEWNEQRGQFYLHQFNKSQPDLNYNNPAVIAEFSNILHHWLKLGISGFRLAHTQYLTEDPDLNSEARSTLPTEQDDYHSLVHVYTKDRSENAAVLTKWHDVVYNHTEGKGLFALQDDIATDILQVFNEKRRLIDLPQNSQFLTTANSSIKATTLHKGVLQSLQSLWPGWDLNGKQHSLRERMPTEIADSITLMTLLLPGTPILRFNDTLSAKDSFATLSKVRSSVTFLYGDTSTKIVNGTVFVYTRLKSGNPGYLVAYQTGDEPASVDLSKIPRISDEINVFAYSPNYVQEGGVIKTKLHSSNVPISPKSTLVLTFVPKE